MWWRMPGNGVPQGSDVMPDWGTPWGPHDGEQRFLVAAPYYHQLVGLIMPNLGDPLVARGWMGAKAALDRLPLPTNEEQWVARWRGFIITVWDVVARAEARRCLRRPTRPAPTQGTRATRVIKTTLTWPSEEPSHGG